MKDKRIVIGISGASGLPYAKRLLEYFAQDGASVYCVATRQAKEIFNDECGFPFDDYSAEILKKHSNVKFFDNGDFYAPIASGSFRFDAMAVCPCSMKTLGQLANSIADNLLLRAAEVALKERRRIVVVARETPLALTHLRNMCTLSEAGAIVFPACPAFYFKTKEVSDIVDFIAARTISAMGFRQNIIPEWGDQ
jgi:4-hydroxy-3-polyprenylbenzoate decarboxylase